MEQPSFLFRRLTIESPKLVVAEYTLIRYRSNPSIHLIKICSLFITLLNCSPLIFNHPNSRVFYCTSSVTNEWIHKYIH